MNWYLKVLKDYAKFDGRARRSEYWYFVLFNIIASFILGFVDGILGLSLVEGSLGLLSGLYSLFVLIPSISVAVRRLHDVGQSGWMLLISLIPCIGVFILLYFLIKDGDQGDNEYGPSPKTVSSSGY